MPIEVTRQGSFIATDANLRFYEIVIMQERASREDESVDSGSCLKTSDGRTVIRKQKGHYQLADIGIWLKSSDPACP
jgi:hypothetical protein